MLYLLNDMISSHKELLKRRGVYLHVHNVCIYEYLVYIFFMAVMLQIFLSFPEYIDLNMREICLLIFLIEGLVYLALNNSQRSQLPCVKWLLPVRFFSSQENFCM